MISQKTSTFVPNMFRSPSHAARPDSSYISAAHAAKPAGRTRRFCCHVLKFYLRDNVFKAWILLAHCDRGSLTVE